MQKWTSPLTSSVVSVQLLPALNLNVLQMLIAVKKQKRQEDERRKLSEYEQSSNQAASASSNEIILSDDDGKDVQDQNDGSFELEILVQVSLRRAKKQITAH